MVEPDAELILAEQIHPRFSMQFCTFLLYEHLQRLFLLLGVESLFYLHRDKISRRG